MIDSLSFFKCSKDSSFFASMSCKILNKYNQKKCKPFKLNKGIWTAINSSTTKDSNIQQGSCVSIFFIGELYENIENIERHIFDLYANHQLNKVAHLNGSFSIVIYDKCKDIIILLSDFLCTKPLYYWKSGSSCTISSSMEALLVDNKISKKIRTESIVELLANQKISGKYTQYENVMCLTGSEIVRIDGEGVESRRSRTMSWDYNNLSQHEQAKNLSAAFKESFQRRYFQNERSALLLSGGLDSRIVLASANNNGVNIPSITLCSHFNNEARTAKMCAEVCSQDFNFLQVSDDKVTKALNKSVYASDGMYAAPINLFESLHDIKDDYDVLFSGHGIDYTLRGMYLPKIEVHGRNSSTSIPLLLPIRTQSKTIAEAIQPLLEKNKNWRSMVCSHKIKEYEGILIDSISEVLSQAKTHNPYNAIDAFIFSTQSKHYTYGEYIAISKLINQRNIAFDPKVLKVYFSMTPQERVSGNIVRKALKILDPRLVKIKNANNNLPAKYPLWFQSAVVLGRSAIHRCGINRSKGIGKNKLHTDGSWINYKELMKSNSDIGRRINELKNNEALLDLGVVSREAISIAIQQHDDKIVDHSKTLHTLVSLSIWLERYS